jgi:hypothetical protein
VVQLAAGSATRCHDARVIVDASQGFYVLRTDAADPSDMPSGSGLKLLPRDDYIVVTTVGHAKDKRIDVIAEYFEHDGARRLDDWPGGFWRAHMARTEVTVSDVLTLTTAKGRTIELTPSGGRFGVAVFARVMAPGEWPEKEPQEHHLLVLWPLSPEIPYPRRELPRTRVTERDEAAPSVTVDSLVALFEDSVTPLVRTDFTDDAAWERIVSALTRPVDFGDGDVDDGGYVPNIKPISEPAFEGLDPEALGRAYDEEMVGYVLLADSASMEHKDEITVLYVDLYDEPGRAFRCSADEVASIEANLAIANMDFEDFADHVDADGVFRGFPHE